MVLTEKMTNSSVSTDHHLPAIKLLAACPMKHLMFQLFYRWLKENNLEAQRPGVTVPYSVQDRGIARGVQQDQQLL